MRILQLPVEISGQAALTADGLRQLGHQANVMAPPHPFGFAPDIPLGQRAGRWRRTLDRLGAFARVLGRHDCFHYHFGQPLLPRYWDVAIIRAWKKRVVTEFWGSEARLPEVEAARNPWFQNAYGEDEAVNRQRLARWSALTDGECLYSDHTFNAFLAPYFSRIHLIGQRVDLARLKAAPPAEAVQIPRVVHAPSKQAFKGTSHVEAAIRALQERGVAFEYVQVEGMAHSDALAVYATADIVVDQLLAGAHGVLACEVMALGKPVIANILPEFQHGYPAGFPIVPATPDDLVEVLGALLQDGPRRRALGLASRAYAERVHDHRQIAANLERIYRGEVPPGPGIFDWRGTSFPIVREAA